MEDTPNAFNIEGFCLAHGVKRSLVYDEIRAGRLRVRKAGRRTLIRKVDADSWLDNLPEGTASKRTGG